MAPCCAKCVPGLFGAGFSLPPLWTQDSSSLSAAVATISPPAQSSTLATCTSFLANVSSLAADCSLTVDSPTTAAVAAFARSMTGWAADAMSPRGRDYGGCRFLVAADSSDMIAGDDSSGDDIAAVLTRHSAGLLGGSCSDVGLGHISIRGGPDDVRRHSSDLNDAGGVVTCAVACEATAAGSRSSDDDSSSGSGSCIAFYGAAPSGFSVLLHQDSVALVCGSAPTTPPASFQLSLSRRGLYEGTVRGGISRNSWRYCEVVASRSAG